MSQQFTEDDFLRLFGEHKPMLIAPYDEDDKYGDVSRFFRMTCCYCGSRIHKATRRDTLYHPNCRQRLRRERKDFLEQHWFAVVIIYLIFIIIENIPSYETKSNTAKS